MHSYSCTCLDATLHCTHIHHPHMIIHKEENSQQEILPNDEEQTVDTCIEDDEDNGKYMVIQKEEEELDSKNKNTSGNILGDITNTQQMDDSMTTSTETIHQYFSQILCTDPTADITAAVQNVETSINTLFSLTQECGDLDALKTVEKHLQSAIPILEKIFPECARFKTKDFIVIKCTA